MAAIGIGVVWQPMRGVFLGGGFCFGNQPAVNGNADAAAAWSNLLRNPPLMHWGSLKSSGLLRSAFMRFDLSDFDGLGAPGSPLNPPDPESDIVLAELVFTASSTTLSSQANLFDTKVFCAARDGQWDNTGTSEDAQHQHGTAAAGFRADGGIGLIDGPGPAVNTLSGLESNRLIILGSNSIGQCFDVPPGGTTLITTSWFFLRSSGTFGPGDNLECHIYPAGANDGSDDSIGPLVVGGRSPIASATNTVAMSGLSVSSFLARSFIFSSPVLAEGRYVAVIVPKFAANGRWYRTAVGGTNQVGNGCRGRLSAMSGTNELAMGTLSPGFEAPSYVSSYNFPHALSSSGTALAGTVREVGGLTNPTTWPTPLVGPFSSPTPAFSVVGNTYRLDVTEAVQAYVDRPAYPGEIASQTPLAFCLGYDVVDADHEREADDVDLVITWQPKARDPACAKATQVIGDRAKADSTVVQRAIAAFDLAQRAKAARQEIPQRGQAEGSVDQRGQATMRICEKD